MQQQNLRGRRSLLESRRMQTNCRITHSSSTASHPWRWEVTPLGPQSARQPAAWRVARPLCSSRCVLASKVQGPHHEWPEWCRVRDDSGAAGCLYDGSGHITRECSLWRAQASVRVASVSRRRQWHYCRSGTWRDIRRHCCNHVLQCEDPFGDVDAEDWPKRQSTRGSSGSGAAAWTAAHGSDEHDAIWRRGATRAWGQWRNQTQTTSNPGLKSLPKSPFRKAP